METSASAHTTRMAKLRAMFIAQIPSKLAVARDLLLVVREGDTPKELTIQLKRIFHNIKGSSASFGLKAISVAAETAELLIDHLMRQPNLYSKEFAAEVGEHINAIDRLVTQIPMEAPPESLDTEERHYVPTAASQRKDSNARKTVYVCDDDDMQISQIHSQLSCFGYDVKSFSSVDALRQAVKDKLPSAVIMDVVFPEGEDAGLNAVSELKEVTEHDIPVIFITGRSDFYARLQAVRAGGTAFLTKPLRSLAIVEHLDTLTNESKPEPYSVLVVDDDPLIASLYASILEDAGIIVHVINNPAATIAMLREFRPELVLMDMYMPGCTGRELAQVIRQMPEYISIPIVYLSSETDAALQQSAMSVGADGFLTKPITPQELVSQVVVRAERMRTLRTLMVRDSLTGLFNHTATIQFLETAVSSAQRRDGTVCFAMIDVDHFKYINDTYGHPVGDQVLLALSRLLRQHLRQNDLIGRYGGEEFAVVLQDASIEKAKEILDAMREDFAGITFWANETEFSVTFSVGIADFPTCQTPEYLCERADNALYVAKRNGRNRVIISQPEAEVKWPKIV